MNSTELFPDLKNEPIRSFVETGWGRFPFPIMKMGLNPFEFAIYVLLNICADTLEEIPEGEALASRTNMTTVQAKAALAGLQARGILKIEGEIWNLTDPKEWPSC